LVTVVSDVRVHVSINYDDGSPWIPTDEETKLLLQLPQVCAVGSSHCQTGHVILRFYAIENLKYRVKYAIDLIRKVYKHTRRST